MGTSTTTAASVSVAMTGTVVTGAASPAQTVDLTADDDVGVGMNTWTPQSRFAFVPSFESWSSALMVMLTV